MRMVMVAVMVMIIMMISAYHTVELQTVIKMRREKEKPVCDSL
jgi:hypothetical protein